MLVGGISDTHDNIFKTEKAIKGAQQKSCGILFHCGDLF
ncbi:MAG TPA: metallophosphoesterase, partial [Thermodesulfobacterium commune]|nr:metallophosphoesterase [Thermodesulfobacterium commune]